MFKQFIGFFAIVVSFMIFPTEGTFAQNPPPLYISKMPLSDYTLFATGGWDGNWYVGSNQAWIEKINLSKHKQSDFSRAYVGAKLGRMKSEPAVGKPSWIRKAYKGSIYFALSATSSWKWQDSFLLTNTDDIPLQYDYENAIKEVGEARWFWREIPIEKLNFGGDNYIILWSPDEYFNSTSSAPILAAAWGTRDVDSWILTSINPSGKPTLVKADEDPLKTPITIFEPAIALKLIPSSYKSDSNAGLIEIVSFEDASTTPPIKKITVSVSKIANIEKCWLEASNDFGKTWYKISRYLYDPPYIFSTDVRELPSQGKILIRAVAEDIYGDKKFSRGDFEIIVSTNSKR